MAAYFRVSRWTIARAIDQLVNMGFFEPINKECFHPSVYRVLGHCEWAEKHPGLCIVKETLPWSGEEGDRLGRDLWNVSGGKVKYKEFQLKALRNTGLSDDEILRAFQHLIANEFKRRKEGGWQGRYRHVPLRFLKWVNGTMGQGELDRLGLTAFSGWRRTESDRFSGIGV